MMLPARMLLLTPLAFLALLPNVLPPARAAEYGEQAERMMKLHQDLDSVEEMLQPAAAAPNSRGEGQTPRAALPLQPNSTLDGVVVFRDRALVTRLLSAAPGNGALHTADQRSVTFEGLPLGLDAESLHAQVRTGGARIVGVELVSGRGKVVDTERVTALRKQAQEVADQLGEVRDRVESLLAQRDVLRGMVKPGGDRPLASLEQMRTTLAYVGDAERDLAARLRKELEAAGKLDEALQPLLIQLADPLATGQTVRVDLEAGAAGSGGSRGDKSEIALSYQVAGASWRPSYNARLDDATGQVTLEYAGIVVQDTGEAWTNASLLLSTADPAVSGDLPRLEPWYLGSGGYNLEAGSGYSSAPDNEYRPMDKPPTSAVSSEMTATVQGSGTAVFAIPGRRTIAGDGSEQRVPIGTQTFRSTIELATVPKLVPEVYRRARVRYEGQVPLLPGAVSDFVGADYVGAGSIGAIVSGEDLELAFGTDDHYKVERQLIDRQVESLSGKRVRYTFRFRVRVSNHGGTAGDVLVTDQLPVSQLDKVVVQRLEGTPELPAQPDDPAGLLRWKASVAPGASQEILIAYSVTAPRDLPMRDLEQLF